MCGSGRWRDTTWFCRSFEMLPSPQEPLADSKLALVRSGSPLIPPSLWLDTRRFNTDKSTTSIIRVNMGAAAMIGGGRRNLRVTFTLLLLSFLASGALAGVIGVDLGSEFMKVSLVRTTDDTTNEGLGGKRYALEAPSKASR